MISLNPGSYEVYIDEREVHCSPKEFDILSLIIEQRGDVISRDSIIEKVWGANYVGVLDIRTVDQHVARLRQKLGRHGGAIQMVPTRGYKFRLK